MLRLVQEEHILESKYTYKGTFTLPGECVDWTFSVSECCRNALITNLTNPGGDNIYVEAVLNNTGNIGVIALLF